MDALLGAAALGDIGKHFPDNDVRYLGADSIELLKTVSAVLTEHGWRLGNLDATVIAQRPKLAPYIDAMRARIARRARRGHLRPSASRPPRKNTLASPATALASRPTLSA